MISQITSLRELTQLIEAVGFLPLFACSIPGYSVEEHTSGWFTGDPARDPWQWRMEIAARGEIAYGKFFERKSGFVSKAWYPVLANYRRAGYDFDARYEDGLASMREKKIMDLFLHEGDTLPAYVIRKEAGFSKEGERGFDGTLTALQMKSYLLIRRMEKKRNKAGRPYGWPVSCYCTAETLFGAAHVRGMYDEAPEQSLARLVEKLSETMPEVDEKTMLRFFR